MTIIPDMRLIHILVVFQVVLSVSFAETISKPDSSSLPQKDWLLWGTYRPNLISAITQHSKTPITVGLAYATNFGAKPSFETFKNSFKLRMNQDSRAHYLYHNGFDFARQKIEDKSLGLTYSVDFLKNQTSSQSWSYTVNSEKTSSPAGFDPKKQQSTSTYLYIGFENLKNNKNPEDRVIRLLKYINQESYQSILLNVWDPVSKKSQGYFRVTTFEDRTVKLFVPKLQETFYCLVHGENEIEDIVYGQLKMDILRGFIHFDPKSCHENSNPNFFMLQVAADQNVKITVSFSSEEIPDLPNQSIISEALVAQEQNFNQLLDSKFGIKNLNKYRFDIGEIKAIQRLAISNIMGRIESSYESNMLHFKTLPSRIATSHQPFLGEGYSQELVCQWNSSLCFQMMNAWTDILPLLECNLLKSDEGSHSHPKSDLLTLTSSFRPIFHFLKLAKNNQTNHEMISFLLKTKTILKNFLLNLQIQSDKSYICKPSDSEIIPEEFSLWVLYLTQGALAIEQLIEQDVSEELSSLQKTLLNSLPSQNYFNLNPFIFDDDFDSFELIENILTQYGVRESNDNGLSPISVPFNYMLLANLHKNDKNPHLYKAIRENLIKLISSNWRVENNLWNSYDSFTGIGKGLPDFSGATSLIALIYSEIY